MKLCKRRYYDIDNRTSTHYITVDDIIRFHGKEFYNQFKEFMRGKPLLKFGNDEGYYYVDYDMNARKTNSFLNPI